MFTLNYCTRVRIQLRTLSLCVPAFLLMGAVAYGADDQAPVLNVDSATIEGTFTGTGANPSVTVNGDAAQLTGQSWSKNVALQNGDNNFEAVASGANGQSQPKPIVINVGAPQTSGGGTDGSGGGGTDGGGGDGTNDGTNGGTNDGTNNDTNGGGDGLNPLGTDTGTGVATEYEPMSIQKMKLKLNFKTASADSVILKAYLLPPEGLILEGQSVTVDIGGARWTLQLDAKGRARSAHSRLKIKVKKQRKNKPSTPQNARLLFKARGADATSFWDKMGLINETIKDKAVTVPARVSIGGKTYGFNATLSYKAKVDVKGLAK